MRFNEALVKLVDDHYRQHCEWNSSPSMREFLRPRDVWVAQSHNVRIAADVFGWLDGDYLYQDKTVDYDVFDNCREWGLTVTVAGWTFCAYEHRNSGNICIEGCREENVKHYGPYGGEDKWDVLASFPWRHGYEASLALEDMIRAVREDPAAVTRADLVRVAKRHVKAAS